MIDFESLEMSEDGKKGLADFVAYFADAADMESERLKQRGILPDEPSMRPASTTRSNWLDLVRVTMLVEVMLDMGHAGLLLEVAFGETYEKDGVCFGRNYLGHEITAEFFEIWLRTQIARDKLMFFNMGLFRPESKKENDLKSGKFVMNKRQQVYAFARLEQARQNAEFISMVKSESGRLDPVFFQRMGRLLKEPGKKQEEIAGTRLQHFLLDCWATNCKDRKGELIPPLCYYSDKAISNFADFYLGMNSNTAENVRKTWIRLGLKRSEKPPIKSIKMGNGKMLVTEFKSRS